MSARTTATASTRGDGAPYPQQWAAAIVMILASLLDVIGTPGFFLVFAIWLSIQEKRQWLQR
ncbi:hypothetical protein ACFXO9_31225 [Nocardia tengchongensis]|uniref:hypothetical protein n=1 Tax=Nocardia tengchongensis TaxID=2055889 RepID=UPI00368B1FF3